ncbi:MAG: hypothetical protein HC814_03335 [Rhodobacteraceae bacterium]|nr:hypothetical protein [Paracoccaceae bacterium]
MATFNRVPAVNPSWKYERLGPMALENHRQYCVRHGIDFLSEAPETRGMPHCWGKFEVLLDALDRYEWVIWADSDTLILDPTLIPSAYLAEDADLLSQCPVEFLTPFGLSEEDALCRMPVNTGVFMIRGCRWSKELLAHAASLTHHASGEALWNGIGDQEALAEALVGNPDWRAHVRYVADLQCHPRFYRSGILFVHLFGNRIEPVLPPDAADRIVTRWEERVARMAPLNPGEAALLHLACTQCKPGHTHEALGDPDMILYPSADELAEITL